MAGRVPSSLDGTLARLSSCAGLAGTSGPRPPTGAASTAVVPVACPMRHQRHWALAAEQAKGGHPGSPGCPLQAPTRQIPSPVSRGAGLLAWPLQMPTARGRSSSVPTQTFACRPRGGILLALRIQNVSIQRALWARLATSHKNTLCS